MPLARYVDDPASVNPCRWPFNAPDYAFHVGIAFDDTSGASTPDPFPTHLHKLDPGQA